MTYLFSRRLLRWFLSAITRQLHTSSRHPLWFKWVLNSSSAGGNSSTVREHHRKISETLFIKTFKRASIFNFQCASVKQELPQSCCLRQKYHYFLSLSLVCCSGIDCLQRRSKSMQRPPLDFEDPLQRLMIGHRKPEDFIFVMCLVGTGGEQWLGSECPNTRLTSGTTTTVGL